MNDYSLQLSQEKNEENINYSQINKFIIKLLSLLSNHEIKDIICWNQKGNIVEIRDVTRFKDEVLARNFKHNSLPNFVRQLNVYSFKKIKKYGNKSISAYSNPFFLRDDHSKLQLITRNKTEISEEGKCQVQNKLSYVEKQISEQLNKNNTLLIHSENLKQEGVDKLNYIQGLESFIYYLVKGKDSNKSNQIQGQNDKIECFFTNINQSYKLFLNKKRLPFQNKQNSQSQESPLKQILTFPSFLIDKNDLNGNSLISTDGTGNNFYENILKLGSNMSVGNPFNSSNNITKERNYYKNNNDDSYFDMNSSIHEH